MLTKIDAQNHKIESLNILNDAETYIIITEDTCAMKGTIANCATILAQTMVSDNNVRKVIMHAIESIIGTYTENEDDN